MPADPDLVDHLREQLRKAREDQATLQIILRDQRKPNERAQRLMTQHKRGGLGQQYLDVAPDWVEELLAENQRLMTQHKRGGLGQQYLDVAPDWVEELLAENQRLKLMGANRACIEAAMRSYWGEEGLQPAWRQQQEAYDFGRALHAAVEAALKERPS